MIEELLNEINSLDFDYVPLPISLPAAMNWNRKIVVYNPDTVTPYYLKHEIIHIKERHQRRLTVFNGNDERNPNERDAADEAIHELMKHHLSLNGRFNYIDFMNIYGVPCHLEQSVIAEMSDINMYVN